MKKLLTFLTLLSFCSFAIASDKEETKSLKSNFILGNPAIQSMNALSFGPEGILFVGDSKSASVFAIETEDGEFVDKAEAVNIPNIDLKLAEVLGTTTDHITIQDLAVNPISKRVYLSVHHSNGTPVLVAIRNGKIEPINTSEIMYSKVEIGDAVASDAKDQRGRSLRQWAISDLEYSNGKVMVSGLSNQEFSSTFRSISFPFTDTQDYASLEIYHAAHGRYETYAPIKTFTSAEINGQSNLIASYTCTPLVLFPLNSLNSGEHIKGRTVAELGNGNTPLDMITMEKEGETYLLMANSNRAVMKISLKDIAAYQESLTEPVKERSATRGVNFIALPMVNVLQMDKLDDSQFVVIQRKSNGDLNLSTSTNR